MSRTLVALVRDEEGKVRRRFSDSNFFQSHRDFSYLEEEVRGWNPQRRMERIPLYYADENIVHREFSEDYELLPEHLKRALEKGLLMTSGYEKSKYSILMPVTINPPDKPLGSRTGVLLYEGWPIIVTVDNKDFLVEIKGVGRPDGKNDEFDIMQRAGHHVQDTLIYGHLNRKGGENEFNMLEKIRAVRLPSYTNGDSPRSLALFSFQNNFAFGPDENLDDFAYLIRLTPTNVRASFTRNKIFEQNPSNPKNYVVSLANEFTDLLERGLLYTNMHPENVLKINGKYVFTDYADCASLEYLPEVKQIVGLGLPQIQQLKGVTPMIAGEFFKGISDRLNLKWRLEYGYDGFVKMLWNNYLAQKTYELRIGNSWIAEQHNTNLKNAYDVQPLETSRNEFQKYITKHLDFLERELDMLKHVKKGNVGEDIRLANERIKYLKETPSNQIFEKFVDDNSSFYDLIKLPYMLK